MNTVFDEDRLLQGDKKCSDVAYVYSKDYVTECNRGYKIRCRASMVHKLIEAYGLLPFLNIVSPKLAKAEELTEFHSFDYIEHLAALNCVQDLDEVESESVKYGLGYDCPLIPHVFDYVKAIAGGTITAAECLVDGHHRIAINWNGGWHHGKKDEAAGFCYINDIVLAILKLRTKFDKILYIDLDLHHGDGVEDAFAFTTKVMTVSLHKYENGFFPGSGKTNDVGNGRAKYYAVNVPLLDGVKDEQFFSIFKSVIQIVRQKFPANAIVCQCGADGLTGDPMNSFSLTQNGIGLCIKEILRWNIPTLFLGGGGYNFANTARCWTYLTALIVNKTIPSDIPDNDYFSSYGPGFDLEITPSNRTNYNTKNYINEVLNAILENLKHIEIN